MAETRLINNKLQVETKAKNHLVGTINLSLYKKIKT